MWKSCDYLRNPASNFHDALLFPSSIFWGRLAILLASGKSSRWCFVTPLKKSRFVWPRDWKESRLHAKTLNQREFLKKPCHAWYFRVLLMFWVSLGETSAKDLEHYSASQASSVFFQLLAKYCKISLSKRGNNEQVVIPGTNQNWRI